MSCKAGGLASYVVVYLGFPGGTKITAAALSKTRSAHDNSKMPWGFESHSGH